MLYIIILFYILFLIWKYDVRRHTSNKWVHYGIVLLIFILVAGLSYRLGVDTIRYEYYFYDPYEYTWDGLFKHITRSHGEPLFVLTNLLVKDTFGEFFVSRLVMSIFYNTVFFWFVRKHSPAPFTTIFLYAIFVYLNFNFQVIRETMAVACFLIGFDGMLQTKPNYIRYVCCIVLATGFHHFAFVALLFPLAFAIKPNYTYLFFLVILLFSSTLISMMIGNIVELELLDDSLSNKVENYMESSRYGQRTISSLVNWFVFFFANIIPFCIMVFLTKKANTRLVSLALLYILITVLRYTSFGILFRINSYLFFCFAIVVTHTLNEHVYSKNFIVNKFKHQESQLSLCMLCITVIIAFRIVLSLGMMVMYSPYSSVITHDLDEDREFLYRNMGLDYKHD